MSATGRSGLRETGDVLPSPASPSAVRLLGPFAAAYFLSYLLRTFNAVIAPDLTRELALGPADLGLVTGAYFFAFALAQIPVGVALDRLGPRRVEAVLLLVAAAGVLLFARAQTPGQLALGRGLVGLGVSACLMAPLKTFGAFPAERHASLTGAIMAAGALGAIGSSLPLTWALPHVGWRGAALVIAAATLVAAPLVARDHPRVPFARSGGPWRRELATLGGILGARAFWRFGPQALLFTGGFMAVQGLWIVPWLMTVDGRSREEAAAVAFWLNGGMLAGQLAIAALATRLARAGVSRERLMAGGLSAALALEALLLLGAGSALWFGFAFFTAAGAQVYGVTAARFPPELSGRVTTALNLLAFAGAFGLQWGIGLGQELLAARGVAAATSLRVVLCALLLGKVAALVNGVAARRAEA